MSKLSVRRFMGAGFIGAMAVALSACGGGVPSEGDLKDAMMEGASIAGVDEVAYEEYVDCVVPKLTDNMSDDGLERLMDEANSMGADGNVGGMSDEDSAAMNEAMSSCMSILMPEVPGS